MTERQWLMIAAAGGLLAVGLAAVAEPIWPALAIAASTGSGASVVDLAERRIPTRLVAIGAGGALASVLVSCVRSTSFDHLGSAGLGLLVLGAPYFVIHMAPPKAVGFGDVRLAALLGAVVGFGSGDGFAPLAAAFLASILALVVMVVVRRRSIPYAPCLVVVAMAVLVATSLT